MLTRLLNEWADRYRLPADSTAAAAQVVVTARARQAQSESPLGYHWWRRLGEPTQQVLARMNEHLPKWLAP